MLLNDYFHWNRITAKEKVWQRKISAAFMCRNLSSSGAQYYDHLCACLLLLDKLLMLSLAFPDTTVKISSSL
jgi:hypothetical protein